MRPHRFTTAALLVLAAAGGCSGDPHVGLVANGSDVLPDVMRSQVTPGVSSFLVHGPHPDGGLVATTVEVTDDGLLVAEPMRFGRGDLFFDTGAVDAGDGRWFLSGATCGDERDQQEGECYEPVRFFRLSPGGTAELGGVDGPDYAEPLGATGRVVAVLASENDGSDGPLWAVDVDTGVRRELPWDPMAPTIGSVITGEAGAPRIATRHTCVADGTVHVADLPSPVGAPIRYWRVDLDGSASDPIDVPVDPEELVTDLLCDDGSAPLLTVLDEGAQRLSIRSLSRDGALETLGETAWRHLTALREGEASLTLTEERPLPADVRRALLEDPRRFGEGRPSFSEPVRVAGYAAGRFVDLPRPTRSSDAYLSADGHTALQVAGTAAWGTVLE